MKPKVLIITVAILFLLYSLTAFSAAMGGLMKEKRVNGEASVATDITHTLEALVQAGLPNKAQK